jgi:hypothetical protein
MVINVDVCVQFKSFAEIDNGSNQGVDRTRMVNPAIAEDFLIYT